MGIRREWRKTIIYIMVNNGNKYIYNTDNNNNSSRASISSQIMLFILVFYMRNIVIN